MRVGPQFARCPGCQDLGDAEHIAACAGSKILGAFGDGSLWIMLVVEKQLHRRGVVDWSRLLAAVEYADRQSKSGRNPLIRLPARRDR